MAFGDIDVNKALINIWGVSCGKTGKKKERKIISSISSVTKMMKKLNRCASVSHKWKNMYNVSKNKWICNFFGKRQSSANNT